MQHVPFENPAYLEEWAKNKNHNISKTFLFNNESLPSADEFDWLVILGGPMTIYEEEKYPWLMAEKYLIAEALVDEKVILGVCLGAQLLADVLGSKVYKNHHREIGWFPVSLTQEASKSTIFSSLPKRFVAFHWHSETMDLPSGCIRIAESNGCINQAFEYDERVIGLQFHLESTEDNIKGLLQNCEDELVNDIYVQTPDEIRSDFHKIKESNHLMNSLLDTIEQISR